MLKDSEDDKGDSDIREVRSSTAAELRQVARLEAGGQVEAVVARSAVLDLQSWRADAC